jgi:cholesterol transport system auxiliary component
MNHRMIHNLLISGLILVILSVLPTGGCVQLRSPVGQAPAIYLLEANLESAPRQPKSPSAPVAVVAVPNSAAPGYDTKQMAYMRHTSQLEYYTTSRWVDTPVRMLTPLLVKALEQQGVFRAVVLAPAPVKSDYLINLDMIRLLQEFTGPDSRMRLTLQVEVIDREGLVLASRLYDVTEPADSPDAVGGVLAANRLLERLLPEIATFCAAETLANK